MAINYEITGSSTQDHHTAAAAVCNALETLGLTEPNQEAVSHAATMLGDDWDAESVWALIENTSFSSDCFEIKVDEEYNAETFWGELDEQLPAIADELRNGPTTVDAETWAKIQSLDGFSDGPEHAKTALVEVSR